MRKVEPPLSYITGPWWMGWEAELTCDLVHEEGDGYIVHARVGTVPTWVLVGLLLAALVKAVTRR